ncbi:MAG: 30S ribosomal protein S12 methylthiotransferase RimO [Bacilli bacterium]|nr:30S ribosomal protein S12 methylthiotransferase RimO [Bacilli bacterium]
MQVALISLGCAKNLVDSEMALGLFKKDGYQITNNLEKADLIVINTCGFIQSAKEEAINMIFNMLKYKKENKKIMVMGCLSQRYKDILENEIPEVDRFVAIDEYHNFGEIVLQLMGTKTNNQKFLSYNQRVIGTPNHWAYVRIADGCDNHCSYCAIPLIRGKYKSRQLDDIYKEVDSLVKNGYKEIVLISQDTTRYGKDINTSIEELLEKLSSIKDLKLLRFLYLYPDDVTKELIQVVKNHDNIAPYFDIPMQHGSNRMLKLMNRRGTTEKALELIDYIKKEVPNAIFRTTLMVGFDYETDEDFDKMIGFVEDAKFDRLGVFKFSKEEDTPAAMMHGDIDEETKNKRYQELLKVQRKIAIKNSKKQVGKIHKAFIESYDSSMKKYKARSYAFAGDEVDGWIYLDSDRKLNSGDEVKVKIVGYYVYDLLGEII